MMSLRTIGHISQLIELAANEKEKVIFKALGPGENQFILLYSDYYQMRYTILIDNVPMAYGRFRYIQPTFIRTYQGGPDASAGQVGGPGIWLAQYASATDNYGIVINLPLKWKVSLIIKATNIDGANAHDVQASIIYDKLEETPTLEVPKPDIQQPNAVVDPKM